MPGFLNSIFGSKPVVPDLTPVNFGEQQQVAVAENQAALPGIENLASSVNTFNEAELAKQMGVSVGAFRAMKTGTTNSISDLLKGNIPSDVLDAIQREGAARGLFSGVGGAPASRSCTAADLGRTSLNIFSSWLDAATRWMASNKANSFDVTSMFITPQQQVQQATAERDAAWNVSWLKNQVTAMPDPVAHAIWAVVHQIGMMALGAVMGGKPPADTDVHYAYAPGGGPGAQAGAYQGGAAGVNYGAGGGAGASAGAAAGASGGFGGFGGI